jgi:hypothetical protein
MKNIQLSLLHAGLLGCCLLGGCVGVPTSRHMTGQSLPHAATIHDSAIVTVTGGEKGSGLISNENFAAALVESLRRTGMFNSVGTSGTAMFRLDTTIEDLSLPMAGFNMTVNLRVDWRLVRLSDNAIAWHDTISTTCTKTVGDAFAGAHRENLATEGAARKNIEQGINELAGAKY